MDNDKFVDDCIGPLAAVAVADAMFVVAYDILLLDSHLTMWSRSLVAAACLLLTRSSN